MVEIAITLGWEQLQAFATALLQRAGVAGAHADIVAQSLVAANLRGVDSHGVQLLSYYLNQIEHNNIDVNATGEVANVSGGTMLYDACNGLGAVVSEVCCQHANRLAAEHGIAMVVVKNANHFGACAFWARKMSEAGNIGIVLCNASPLVAPWQGKQVRFGTNPICMAVPGDRFLLDMATTAVAANKIYKAATNNVKEIPAGWAMDSEGRPTTDPKEAMNGGLVMPLGGYKGYGLAIMVEILCAVLGGGAISTGVGGIRILDRPMNVSQTFLAINPKGFLPNAEFEPRMASLVDMLKSVSPAAGYDEVLVAGEPEERIEQQRRATGVPVEAGVWERLLADAARLGVSPPA